jgi:hypothetical protein
LQFLPQNGAVLPIVCAASGQLWLSASFPSAKADKMLPVSPPENAAPEEESAMAVPNAQEQARVSIRLPADHFEVLEQRAAEEDRTVSAEIRRLVRRYVTEVRGATAT